MAVRRATRTFDDLVAFLDEYQSTILQGAIMLPPDAFEGELANEIRLDFVLPVVGRVGPVKAQVVHRSPDGAVALRMPNVESELVANNSGLFEYLDKIKAYLVSSGAVVLPDTVTQLRDEMVELQKQLEAEKARPTAAVNRPVAVGEGGASEPGAPTGPLVRGIPVPDLTGVAPVEEGTLGSQSLRDALMKIAVDRRRGMLTLRCSDGGTRYGFWERGGPVAWRRDPLAETETLGMLLLKANQISKEQLGQSLQTMEERNCRQGDALMEMGVLTFPQLIMVLGKQCEYVLQQAMAEKEGEWAFHDLEQLPEKFLPSPLRIPSLLFRSMLKKALELRTSDVGKVLVPYLDRYVRLSEGIEPVMKEIKFAALERKFIEVLHGNSWRLRELLSVSPLPRSKTSAVVMVLIELQLIDFGSEESSDRYLKRVGQRIVNKRNHLSAASHFDILEIHWIAVPDEVNTAYKRLLKEFDPKAYNNLPKELVTNIAEIREKVEESYQVLRNDHQRRAYRAELIEDFMILQSADMLAKKGEMAIMRKDRRDAEVCFSKALELVPGHPASRSGMDRAAGIM